MSEGEEKRLGEGRGEVCVCLSEGRLGVAMGEEEGGRQRRRRRRPVGDRTDALLTRQGQRPKDMEANFHFLKGRLQSERLESSLGASPPPPHHF